LRSGAEKAIVNAPSRAVLAADREQKRRIQELEDSLLELTKTVAVRDKEIKKLKAELKESKTQVTTLQGEVSEGEEMLESLKKELKSKEKANKTSKRSAEVPLAPQCTKCPKLLEAADVAAERLAAAERRLVAHGRDGYELDGLKAKMRDAERELADRTTEVKVLHGKIDGMMMMMGRR